MSATTDPAYDVRVLDDDGAVVDPSAVPELSDEEFIRMYHRMRFARRFDERGISLQRQGRMGTFSPVTGQEGSLIGSQFALSGTDWIVPYYRDHAATVAHGLPPENALEYYMGHESGNDIPDGVRVFPVCITIGGHLPHATGMAWASKLKGREEAFLCYFGEGATSEGDFHEGLTFAGVFDTPTVFFCLNNQWAISTPVARQTASDTIAQKAAAYGIEGVRVDGADPLAVYQVTRDAVERAKNPVEGASRPTLIEAVQYRLAAHSTSDDPSNYRDEAETERWREKDPIPRFETFLRESGRLDDETVTAIETEIEAEIADAVEAAEAAESDRGELFEHTFADPTPTLDEQRTRLERFGDEFGGDESHSE